MPASLKKYLVKASALTASLFLLGFILYLTPLKQYFLPVYILLPLFFFVINLLIYLLMLKASVKNPYKFNNYFMVTSMAKLLLYFSVLILYFLFVKSNLMGFTVVFLSLYIIFTFFETRAILKTLKKGQKNT